MKDRSHTFQGSSGLSQEAFFGPSNCESRGNSWSRVGSSFVGTFVIWIWRQRSSLYLDSASMLQGLPPYSSRTHHPLSHTSTPIQEAPRLRLVKGWKTRGPRLIFPQLQDHINGSLSEGMGLQMCWSRQAWAHRTSSHSVFLMGGRADFFWTWDRQSWGEEYESLRVMNLTQIVGELFSVKTEWRHFVRAVVLEKLSPVEVVFSDRVFELVFSRFDLDLNFLWLGSYR